MGEVRYRDQLIISNQAHLKTLYQFITVNVNKLCGRPPQYAPPLQVDLFTLKVVSESRMTWATSVPILLLIASSVLDLDPMYAADRRQTRIIT